MYAFTINIVDSSIDAKICKEISNDNEGAGKCKKHSSSGDGKLRQAFGDQAATSTEKVGSETSKTIANDTAALSREEKGTVASVFAKVIEGAEVLETKGVSATSVMVNACYDLVSESIGVVPMLPGLQNKYGKTS